MSTHIENQVVSMQFDNKHFESNVKTSLSTLDKLKQSLKLHDAAKGFENISSAAKKVNLNPIGSAAEAVGLKFNALYTVADQTMRNITNTVERYAHRIVSAFAIDPITTGFKEYETKINAIQVIKANTRGKNSMSDITEALDELNLYADKTIYNFAQMTSNVGKFTAQGFDVKAATDAVKGLANLAAASGASAEDMARATYQMSQALGSSIKLMDWNSLRNANMATQELKNTLIDLAKVNGIAIDDMIAKHGSFEQTLSEGWLSGKMFTEAMNIYSGVYSDAELKAKGFTDKQIANFKELAEMAESAATEIKTFTQLWGVLEETAQSGWTQTWELLIGDFDEAKNLWSTLGEVFGDFINKSSESRNKLLSGALDNSGWDNFIAKVSDAGVKVSVFEEAVKEAAKKHNIDVDAMVKEYGSLEKAVQKGKISIDILKEALGKVFGKKGQKDFEEYTVKAGDTLSELAEKWNTSVEEIALLNNIKDIDKINIGQILKIPKAIEKTGKEAKKAEGDLESFEEALKHVRDAGGKELLHESVANAWQGLTSILGSVGKAFREVFPPMQSEQLFKIIQGVNEFSKHLVVSKDIAGKLQRTFKGVFAIFGLITDILGGGLKLGFDILNKVLGKFNLGILDVTAGIGDAIVSLRNNFGKVIDNVAGSLAKGASAVYNWIAAFIELPAVQKALGDISTAFSDIKDAFSGRFSKVVEQFNAFVERVKALDSFSLDNIGKVFSDFWNNVLGLFWKNQDGSTIFDGLISALKNLKETAGKYLEAAGETFTNLQTKVSTFFTSIKNWLSENIGAIIAVGSLVGLFLLVKKIKDAVALLINPLATFDDVLDSVKNALDRTSKALSLKLKADAVLSIAKAIGILAASLIALSFVDWTKLLPAGGVLIGLIVALTFLVKAVGKAGDLSKIQDTAKVSIALLGLAGALVMLSIAANILGKMEPGELLQAGIVVGAFLVAVSILSKHMGTLGNANYSQFGTMMIKLSAGLLVLGLAARILGGMDTETLKRGGLAVGAFLLMIAGIMQVSKGMQADLPKFGSMMIGISTALILMSAAVAILGNMDTKTLLKGGLAVGAFVLMFAGIMNLSKGIGKDVPKFGGMMLGISVGLLAMAFAVKILGGMDTKAIVKGGIVTAAFLGMMVGLMAATKLIGENTKDVAKIGAVMLSFSAAMLIMTASIAALSLIDGKDLIKAVGAITVVGVIFAGLIAVTHIGQSMNWGTIIALSAGVAILAAAIAGLSFVDPKRLTYATLAVGLMTGLFTALVNVSKGLTMKSALSVLVTSVAVVGTLSFLLVAIASVIRLMEDIPAEQALGTSAAISLLVASLSASLLMISKATKGGRISITGIGKMALALGAIGVVAGVLAGIGIAFLPTIGEKLSGFLEALLPFFNGVGDINPNIVNSIGTLVKAMAALAAASAVFAVADKFTHGGATKSFGAFINWIKELLPVVRDFGLQLSGPGVEINTANLDAVIDAVGKLSEAAAKAPSATIAGGGFGSKWGGGGIGIISVPMLTAAKNWIKEVAPVVKDLSLEVSKSDINIDKTNIEAVCSAASLLAEAASKAPSVTAVGGGFTSKWVSGGGGVIDWPLLSQAKDWIIAVAPVVQGLASAVTTGDIKELNIDALNAICAGAKTLAEAAASAPSVDLAVGFAKGPWGFGGALGLSHPMINAAANWIIKIKDPIIALATAVSDTNIPDFNADNLTSVVTAVDSLAKAADAAPTVDAGIAVGFNKLLGFFLGAGISHPMISATADFIDNIEEPITNLAKSVASLKMEDLDIDKFETIIQAVVDISSVKFPTLTGGGLLGIGGMLGFTIGGMRMVPQIDAIAGFITSVKEPITNLATATATGISTDFNTENFNTIVKAITDIAGAKYPTTYVGGLGLFSGLLAAAGAGGFYSAPDITAVKDFIVEVKQPIIDLANATKDGLSTTFNPDNFNTIVKAITDIASAKFPEYTEGQFEGFSLFAGYAKGGFTSAADITAAKDFIVEVKQPIIDLAKEVSGESDSSLKDFKTDNFNTIVKAIVDLASAKYPGIENVNFETFGVLLKKLQFTDQQRTDFEGFVGFVDQVKDPIIKLATAVSGTDVNIDTEKVTSIVSAVKTLAEGTEYIPTTGGMTNWWKGETDFGGFAEFLAGLAEPLGTLTSDLSTTTIDPVKIESAAKAVAVLAQAADAIPEEGGWQSFWNGDTAWDTFKSNLKGFGEGIAGFSEAVIGIDPTTTKAGSSAVKYVAEALNFIGTNPNWYNIDELLGYFSDASLKLTDTVKTFSDNVATINVGSVNAASGIITAIVNAFVKLSGFDYTTVDVTTFKSKLSELATAMTDFSNNAGNIDPSGAISTINELVGMLSTIGSTEFGGASSFKEALNEVASTSISDFTSQFTNEATLTEVKSAGSGLIGAVAEGITSNTSAVEGASSDAAIAGSAAIESIIMYVSYWSAGVYVGEGFVAGISSQLGSAAAAGTQLGTAALNAAKAALDENSPSKAFYEVGEFAGIGLVNALYDYERNTYKAGYGIGESANFGLSDAISKVRTLIENGIDGQPTIRPVLDLSDISSGADGINRMFNMKPSVGLNAKLSDISTMMEQGQNGGNSDVIAAINKLGSKISESGRDTYNINGITYDDGSNITEAVKVLTRAVLVEGRV